MDFRKEYFLSPYYFFLKENKENVTLYFNVSETLTEARKSDELFSFKKEQKNFFDSFIMEIAKKKKISTIVTFTGFNKNNKLRKLGDINFWTDSKVYNFVENSHQVLLLSIVDLINKTKICIKILSNFKLIVQIGINNRKLKSKAIF